MPLLLANRAKLKNQKRHNNQNWTWPVYCC